MQTFTPDQPGYREEIAGFQTGITSTPRLVVAATSADDVAAAVRLAAERDLPVSVQATGHGLREPAEGVLISTRRMTGVTIDPDRAVARVEAGTTWGSVITAAAEHGLAPLSGSSPASAWWATPSAADSASSAGTSDWPPTAFAPPRSSGPTAPAKPARSTPGS